MEVEEEKGVKEEPTNELLESAPTPLWSYQKQGELRKKRIEENRWQREKENDIFSYGVVCCIFVIIIGVIVFFVAYSLGGAQVIEQFMQIFGKYF